MGYRCGIVGLPNVGKSTTFNLLSKERIALAENFPFCTIDPNTAIVPVVDHRLDQLARKNSSKKKIYNQMQFVDIAGLIEGSGDGKGLGNKFLGNIEQVDIILHVVRCFEDSDVTSVMDRIDPESDLELIQYELQIWDISKIEKAISKCKDRKIIEKYEKAKSDILNGKIAEDLGLNFLTSKKKMILCNGSLDNNYYLNMKKKYENVFCFPVAECEKVINEKQEQKKCEKELLEVEHMIKRGFELLNLITYFTTGPEESRAWSIEKGLNAKESSGKIHSDFKEKFICAQVTSFNDYILGKPHRTEGKDYIVKDGDVIEFMIRK